jgi:hypothetical protein
MASDGVCTNAGKAKERKIQERIYLSIARYFGY